MAKEDSIDVEGIVVNVLPNTKFEVEIYGGHRVISTISGKLRLNCIKVVKGDKVTVAMSPYDLTRGRIVWRHS